MNSKPEVGEVRGVLLVPGEGDPIGLLLEGIGGCRPPIAIRPGFGHGAGHSIAWEPWAEHHDFVAARDPAALILAWDGKVVDAGCRQAWRCSMAAGVRYSQAHHAALAQAGLDAWDGAAELYKASGLAQHAVLVDAEGREVTP